jgi:hypothetical protein
MRLSELHIAELNMQDSVRKYATGKLHIKATQNGISEVWFEANDPTKLVNVSEGNTFMCLATRARGGEYYYVLGVVESVSNDRVNLAPRFTFFRHVNVSIDEKGIKITNPQAEELRTFSSNQDVALHAITPVNL